MTAHNPVTDCVVVTYNPDMALLEKCVRGLSPQVRHCIIVDNGAAAFAFESIGNVVVISLGKNYGIAYAQNRGIDRAREDGADFVLLSDQDTVYPADYVARMLEVYAAYGDKEKIGALSPLVRIEGRTTVRISLTYRKRITPSEDRIYEIYNALASGMIIPVDVLTKIGGMKEEFFIDYVDFEWCRRAAKHGYVILFVPKVSIKHKLGDASIRIGRATVVIRSKLRYYYTIRNGIYIIFHMDVLCLRDRISFLMEMVIKSMRCLIIDKMSPLLIGKAVLDGLRGNLYEYRGENDKDAASRRG